MTFNCGHDFPKFNGIDDTKVILVKSVKGLSGMLLL